MREIPAPSAIPMLNSFADGGVFSVARSVDQELLVKPHRHPHGELFLLHAGHMKASSETGHWLIPPLQICWIPPHALHGSDNHDVEWTRIHLEPGLCTSLPSHPCVWTSTPLTRALFERFAQQAGTYETMSGRERRLLDVLIDELAVARGTAILLPLPRTSGLRAMAQRWQEEPGEMPGLDELAASSNMSRRTLTRIFKQETGMSVGKWRQVARLMAGIDLLSKGETVTHTAMSLGYDSVSSFVVLCQRLTGMSPKSLVQSIPNLRR